MAEKSNWSASVACFGLLACANTWSLARVLWVTMPSGELSLLRGLSIVVGVLLLAVACLRLLVRGVTHGKMFVVAGSLMLINIVHFYGWTTYLFTLGPGVIMALVGAFLGFHARGNAKIAPLEESQ